MIFQPCGAAGCLFDKTATLPIIYFEIFIIAIAIVCLFILAKLINKALLRFFIVAIGIFVFEFFTNPMWHNHHLGAWAYVYQDVSWILTIGWSIMILVPVVVIDKLAIKWKNWQKFLMYLLTILVIGVFAESTVVSLGIRSYADESLAVIKNYYIPYLDIPWGALYYIPVFMTLVIGFYKYWSLVIDKKLLVPLKKQPWVSNLVITLIGVLLFELMIEPMVINAKLPSWLYIYHDINLILSGIWIVVIWLSISLIDKIFARSTLVEKFFGYIIAAAVITAPIEAWLISSGIRIYGPGATANFSGFKIMFTQVPIEILFAIPLYLALIIGFTKYWQFVFKKN